MVKTLKIIISVCAVVLVISGGFIFMFSGNVDSIGRVDIGDSTGSQAGSDGNSSPQTPGSNNISDEELDVPPPINNSVNLDIDVKTDGGGNIVGVDKDTHGRFASSYNKIFESGNFQLEFTSAMDWNSGQEMADMVLAMSGDNMAIKMKMNAMSANIVVRNGKSYLVIPSLMKKAEITNNMPEISGMSTLSTTKMNFINSGEEKVNGQNYDYEKYSFEDGSTRIYYFKNGRLMIIKDVDGGVESVMNIKALRTSITDSSIFRVPLLYGTINLDDLQ